MAHNQFFTSVQKNALLNTLLSTIEQQLNWGASPEWSGADFERLSDLIFEKSQQRLSVTTLKRTWGRTSQTVKPSQTTLNILAHYACALSWREFQSSRSEQLNETDTNNQPTLAGRKYIYLLCGLALGLLGAYTVYGLISDQEIKRSFDSKNVKLQIQKVTKGIPNTVVFRYDIGSLAVDSLELQQSWDERKRILLDPSDSLVTTTYFTPGYFNAKLVADGEIIIRQDLYLPSNGLEVMVFLEEEEIPFLLSKNHWSLGSEGFQLSNTFDESFNNRHKELILIVNLLEEPPIAADTFEFRTSFRLTPEEEGDPCHPISLIITGSEDVYMFGIGNPGCAGEFNFYLGGDYTKGKYADLSSMGFLEDEWVDIEVSKRDHRVMYRSNGKEIMLSDSAQSIGQIGGIRLYSSQKIRFRKLEMQDKNQVIDLLQESAFRLGD